MLKKIEKKLELLLEKKPKAIAIWSFLIVALICFGVGVLVIIPNIIHLSESFNVMKTGPLGDTFNGLLGPFIAFLVAILTFLAFYIQYKANEIQNEANQKLQFESKFFELAKFHRENVNELKLKFKDAPLDSDETIEEKDYEGKQVFKVIFDQFIQCSNELKTFFDKTTQEIYEDGYLQKIQNIEDLRINYKLLAKIDICYLIVFYGVGSEGKIVLRSMFKDRYKKTFYDLIIDYISLKPVAGHDPLWNRWKSISKKNSEASKLKHCEEIYRWRKNHDCFVHDQEISTDNRNIAMNYHNNFIKYYGGHQFRLGHYYRHLFQTVTYINNQSMPYKEKYQYAKILRAQLSTFEQALLFINSLSKLGLAWEYEPKLPNPNAKKIDYQLITKFNFLKNIPGDELYGFTFKDIYPNIQYEGEEIPEKRKEMLNIYS